MKIFLLLLIIIFNTSGCGKKGDLIRPAFTKINQQNVEISIIFDMYPR